MSTTILRTGVWILIIALALFVIDTSFTNSPLAGLLSADLLTYVLVFAGVLIVTGVIARIFSKPPGKAAAGKNKCRVCGVAVPQGAIYCRPHLRGVLEREDRRTHNTRIR
ncbi:MAG: hypothetical protein ACXW2X_03425 [Thermoanaerobaculia bacterium]